MSGQLGFLAAWTLMMIAIMMPSFLPTVLLFETVLRSRTKLGFVAAPAIAFVTGYFAIWIISGLGAALLNSSASFFSADSESLWVGAGLLVAGIYQFSRLKNQCLTHCRSPMDFFMHHWSDGVGGAGLMGFKHGLYCIGCCWGLMVALLVLGMMNPLLMLATAGLIAVEKHLPSGERLAQVTGILLVLLSVVVAASGYPTGMNTGGM